MNDHKCSKEDFELINDHWVCKCGAPLPTPTTEQLLQECRKAYNKELNRTRRLEGLLDVIAAFVEVQHNEKTATWIRKKKEEAIKG